MPLTESVTIPLEGEQAGVFQEIDQREESIRARLKPIEADRNAMVSVILAGKGLLKAVQETPGASVNVTPERGIVITVPSPENTHG